MTYRPASVTELLEAFRFASLEHVTYLDDTEVLEYVAEVASDLLVSNASDPEFEETFKESIEPYLNSFLDEAQASVVVTGVLASLSVKPAAAAAAVVVEAAVEEPSSTSSKTKSAPPLPPAVVPQAAAPYTPKWGTPSPAKPSATPPPPSTEQQRMEPAPVLLTGKGGGQGGAGDLCDTVFSMAFGGRTLLARTQLHLKRGRCYGLVGANGAGKSTLLRNLAGKRLEGLPAKLRVSLVQHAADSSVPMGAGATEGSAQAADRTKVGSHAHDEASETVLQHLQRHAQADNQRDLANGSAGGNGVGEDTAEEFARQVGFTPEAGRGPKTTLVSTLSGGWHMRLSLARAMMSHAELLLLDEPTNHLDTEGVAWLTKYVQGTTNPGGGQGGGQGVTVVLVSHDTSFLNAVVTDVLLLNHSKRKLEHHEGSFASFRQANPEVHAYLTRRSDVSGSGQVLVGKGDKFTLNFPKPDRLDGVGSDTKAVVRLSAVTFAYPRSGSSGSGSKDGNGGASGVVGISGGSAASAASSAASESEPEPELKVVLRNVDCKLTLRSKVACLGGNGAGKSTLVRLLVGDLLPLTGDVYKHNSLRVAYVAQHSLAHVEQHLSKTPCEYLQWRFNGAVDREALSMSALLQGSKDGEAPLLVSESDPNAFVLERLLARRTKHGKLEYECKFVGRAHEENEWRSLLRLGAEGHKTTCLRFDQVAAGVAAGLDLRPLTTPEVQGHLLDFGLDPSFSSQTRIGGLSGGQKSKLVFAAAMWTKPHVLVLDEPTNYLDRETLEALKGALVAFKGAFVCVSHNKEFVTGLCSEEWRVQNGRVKVVAVDVDGGGEGGQEGGGGGNEAEAEAEAEERARLEAEGAKLLGAGGGGSKTGGGGDGGASGSWSAGVQTTANMTEMKVEILKDSKGRMMSKKEARALEKKNKLQLQSAGKAGDETQGGDSTAVESDGASKAKVAAEKKAKREAKKLIKEGVDPSKLPGGLGGLAASAGGGKKSGSKGESVAAQIFELEEELEVAREEAARRRAAEGVSLGPVETESFTLANPGGGANLLEDASFVLVPGRVYGLIGRNGTGKSTMLRTLAARRVAAFPRNLSVHYVAQEFKMSKAVEGLTAVEVVVAADVERRLLLADLARLQDPTATVAAAAAAVVTAAGTDSNAAGTAAGTAAGAAAGAAAVAPPPPAEEQKGSPPSGDGDALMAVVERLEAIEADTAEERARELLVNLGFSADLLARPLIALSGGWRVRVALAAAIFARPDVLLLDEPTNHLSIQAVLWLANEVSSAHNGTASSKAMGIWGSRIVIVVSHDRYFLDQVCTDTLHLSGRAKRLTPSRGNFTTWSTRRKQLQAELLHRQTTRAAEREKLAEFAGHGFRYGGSSSAINMMKMKAKQVDKLDEEAELEREEASALQEDLELPVKLLSGWGDGGGDPTAPKALAEGEVDSSFIVELTGVAFGYPPRPQQQQQQLGGESTPVTEAAAVDGSASGGGAGGGAGSGAGGGADGEMKLLFEGVEFNLDARSRLVLLGENGNGKTTLVKLLLGELKPVKGVVRRNPACRVAMVNQHHAEQLDLSLTPLAFLKRRFPGDGSYQHDQTLRSHLAGCGCGAGLMQTPALALSGGQRSRVALAATSFERPHLLVLDEPTNNLDLEAVEALADAVEAFKGGVVLVSHDQYFVSRVARQVKVVGNGAVTDFESFEAYRKIQHQKALGGN